MNGSAKAALVWFRQDLRLIDNPAFIAACNNHEFVIPLYILDEITTPPGAAQRWWLHHSLQSLGKSLNQMGLPLVLKKGDPMKIIAEICKEYSIDHVYWNRCYEPMAIQRDSKIKANLLDKSINVTISNGALLQEPWEVKTQKGEFYKVYTAYWKECMNSMRPIVQMQITGKPKSVVVHSESLSSWNLLPTNPNWAEEFHAYWTPGEDGARLKLDSFIDQSIYEYKDYRDYPAKNVTSHLSPHIHFGEISVWDIWRAINQPQINSASVNLFLSQLGWREFSYHVLYHSPQLPQENFREKFNNFPWNWDQVVFNSWCKGMTGYPLVDAGMRELWHTGYMHNRVRMVVASFLTKNLLIDWRLGAQWFMDTLLDGDLAINSMSWQWVAGSGLDAAPYFRIFNPILQSQKFDPSGEYIRRWVPELENVSAKQIHQPGAINGYPEPIVNQQKSRQVALGLYNAL